MQQLSELDASFLYMEQETTPMHIGAVYVLNCELRQEPLTFAEFRDHLDSRLPFAPRFRQRLIEAPLRLGYPYWTDDPDFKLENHIFHYSLHDVKNQDELLYKAAQFLKVPLKRSQPLWEIALVDELNDPLNLPGTSCAIIIKVHHSAIDGNTGEGLMSALLDFSQECEHTKNPKAWRPRPLPSKVKLIGTAYENAIGTPLRLAHKARDKATSTYHSLLVKRLQKLALPPALLSAPITIINKKISAERTFTYHEIPLEKLKAIKKLAPGSTLNDIVMTICSEVVMQFLKATDSKSPTRSLIALSPIAVRSKRIDSPTGSELSAMLISLATTEPNLAVRLKQIHNNASASKVYGQAISASRLTDLMPSAMLGLAIRVYTKFQLAQRHKPLFNIPVANIPGSDSYLYYHGARVDYQFATAPLFDGIGLVIMVMSYGEKVTFTFTSCPDVVAHPEVLKNGCNKALSLLESHLQEIDFSSVEVTSEQEGTANNNGLAAIVGDVTGLFSGVFSGVFKSKNKAKENGKKKKSSKNQPRKAAD